MKISQKCEELLKGIEVLALQPYDDQVGIKSAPIKEWCKGATVGYGYLVSKEEWTKYKDGITKQQADELFRNKIGRYEKSVDNSVRVTLSQQQFDACVMLCYNIGTKGFETSSVCKILNGQNTQYANLDTAWLSWNKSQGKVMNGLNNRRKAELKVYHEGVYERW